MPTYKPSWLTQINPILRKRLHESTRKLKAELQQRMSAIEEAEDDWRRSLRHVEGGDAF